MRRRVAVLAVLALVLCYLPTLRGMVNQWWTDEDMGHGFAVPLVIAWIVWKDRARWQALPVEPSNWGFVLLGAGAALQIAGTLGAGLFVSSVAFVLSMAGVVVCLAGFRWLKTWSFPFLLTLFMLPKLAIVYNQVTLPLQLLATKAAAGMLTLAGFAVEREGNILEVSGYEISVVEACNGIRYLLPLGFLALVLAYLGGSKTWVRLALLIAAVPIAILANALRVAVSGLSPLLAGGALHAAMGTVIFLICLGMLVSVHRVLHTPGKA